MDNILDYFISAGIITQDEFDAKVRQAKDDMNQSQDSASNKINLLTEQANSQEDSILDAMEAVADVYEEKEQQIQQKETEILNTMEALADVYEQLLAIQDQIVANSTGGTT